MITLTAREACNPRYTPGAKKSYIARIIGRDSKMTFAREFIGRTHADVDTPGLYETRGVDKKGRADEPDYVLVLPDGDDVQEVSTDKETAMKLAKMLDAGRPFLECVDEDGELVTPRKAETRAAARTIDAAVEACWAALQSLPEREAKKVLVRLRVRVSPPKVPALTESAPVGIVHDAAQEAGASPAALGLDATPVAPFAAGDQVVCLDDSDGAHFLVAGQTYEVCSTQTGDDGVFRVCLVGMARAWEAGRFRHD